jgi:K+-sensing histidine kinase KdpD
MVRESARKSFLNLIKSLQKIGKRFRTFDNQKKQNSKGLGLGLTICQEMIKVMGILLFKKGLTKPTK